MKKIYTLIALMIFCLSANAQETRIIDDIVILKDGSEFKGEITEYVPGSYLIIQTSIKNPIRFSLKDVNRVIQASDVGVGQKEVPFSYNKLYFNTDFSTVIGKNDEFGFAIGGGVVKQFSQWNGWGAGLTYVDYVNPREQSKRVALYGTYRGYMQEKFASPFIQINGGYAFNFEEASQEWITEYNDGYFINPKIGVRIGTEDLMYTVFLGAHFHKTSSDKLENPWGSWQQDIIIRRTELGVGLLF